MFLALVEEFVADGTVLFENRLAARDVAFVAFGQEAADLRDSPFLFLRSGPRQLAPERFQALYDRRKSNSAGMS